jgi:hypothetical protein
MNKLTSFLLDASYKSIQGLALAAFSPNDYDIGYVLYDPHLLVTDERFDDVDSLADFINYRSIAMLVVEQSYDEFKTVELALTRGNGYGPPMYIIAMQEAGSEGYGLASDVDGDTSFQAGEVWDRFYDDSLNPASNIEAHPIGDRHSWPEDSLRYCYTTKTDEIDTSSAYEANRKFIERISKQCNFELALLNESYHIVFQQVAEYIFNT